MSAWLVDPHPPMPNMSLTMAEIDDLATYIMSLRKARATLTGASAGDVGRGRIDHSAKPFAGWTNGTGHRCRKADTL